MNDDSGLPVVTYLSMDPVTSTVGQSQVLNYIERLAVSGLAIELVTFEHHVDTALRARLVDLGVSWRPQNYGRHGAVAGLGRVFRAAGVIRGAALVHARSDMAAAAVILAGIDNWVWDVRSLWADQKVATGVLRSGSPQERILRWVERRSATGSAAVITLTASAIAELDRRYDGIVAPKARVITTCTDLERFSVSPMPTTTTVRVLLPGTLNRYYDMRSMLDLVAELRRRRPVEFVVVSPEATAFEDELSALEVIRLSATPDEMVDLVASCHVGLSVCRDDAGVSLLAAMPTKIGEFLATGRPVVVNPGLADVAEMLEHYECGVAFGASSSLGVVEAADRLEELLQNPRTPARCRLLAESHFDLASGVNSLLEVYSKLST